MASISQLLFHNLSGRRFSSSHSIGCSASRQLCAGSLLNAAKNLGLMNGWHKYMNFTRNLMFHQDSHWNLNCQFFDAGIGFFHFFVKTQTNSGMISETVPFREIDGFLGNGKFGFGQKYALFGSPNRRNNGIMIFLTIKFRGNCGYMFTQCSTNSYELCAIDRSNCWFQLVFPDLLGLHPNPSREDGQTFRWSEVQISEYTPWRAVEIRIAFGDGKWRIDFHRSNSQRIPEVFEQFPSGLNSMGRWWALMGFVC